MESQWPRPGYIDCSECVYMYVCVCVRVRVRVHLLSVIEQTFCHSILTSMFSFQQWSKTDCNHCYDPLWPTFTSQVGRFEVNLISPDSKTVVLEKNFKEISSCCQVGLFLPSVFTLGVFLLCLCCSYRQRIHLMMLVMTSGSFLI